MQDHVALAERAALGVLAGQAQRRALGEQRRERQRLRVRPVDVRLRRRALLQRLAPAIELFDHLRVHGEAVGHAQQLLAQLAQVRDRHRCVHLRAR